MLYSIKFLEKRVSAAQWAILLSEFQKRLKTFALLAHFHHDKLHFYLLCDRSPFSLNANIHPLQIEPAEDVEYPSHTKIRPGIIRGDLLDQVHKHTTKLRSSQRPEFWVEITYGHLARIFSGLRRFRIMKATSTGWERIVSLLPISVPAFLSLDLSKSAHFSLEMVKPKLKTSVEYDLPFDSIGSLCLHNDSNSCIDLSKIDYHRHTLIVGQSGSGKSELLRLTTEELYQRATTDQCGIVIIDPHGKLYEQIAPHVPCCHLNPIEQQIQFFEGQANPLAATELTLDLIETQLSKENAMDMRGKRVLRFVLFALYSAGVMSYENIAHFLNDSEFRMQVLDLLETPVVREFFETEYPELRNRYYDTAILPILNIIGEYQLSISSGEQVSFLDTFLENKIIIVSIPQGKMGSKLTKLYGATIVQQLFLYAQSGLLNAQFTVMIDELPLIYTPSFNQILAESRKFGLGFWVVQQYLSQLPKEALNSLFANASNYFCFKTNVDDARLLAENLNLEIESYTENTLQRSHKELASGTLLDLSRGQLIARLSIEGRCVPATILHMNINAWDTSRNEERTLYA
ncbi:MAG: DUF87 domain-containing protein [Oligoflexia bacterium]|nr:DUF87 domain-containing protein [Oligoflexia bacterium]